MNAQVNLESIELARLSAEVIVLAHSIIALTTVAEDVIANIDETSFEVIYLGRGREIFGLSLSQDYPLNMRIKYAKDMVRDFTKIKTDIEQNYIGDDHV